MKTQLVLALLMQALCGLAATNIPPALARLNLSPFYRVSLTDEGSLHAMVSLPLKPAETSLQCMAGIGWIRTALGEECFVLQLMVSAPASGQLPGLQNSLTVAGSNWLVKATETSVSKSPVAPHETVQGTIDRKIVNRICTDPNTSIVFNASTGHGSLDFTPTARARLLEFLRALDAG